MISNALKLAQNEYVVYFLLTSYLDARRCDRRGSALPEYAKRLPIAGKTDVDERLCWLSAICRREPTDRANVSPILKETVAVLRAASERIVSLRIPCATRACARRRRRGSPSP